MGRDEARRGAVGRFQVMIRPRARRARRFAPRARVERVLPLLASARSSLLAWQKILRAHENRNGYFSATTCRQLARCHLRSWHLQ